VHIWDGNTTREFLDSRGLQNYREGLIGPGYGFQWRHFNAPYNAETGSPTEERGIDQLNQIIAALKDPSQRTSRRLIMTAWNPMQLDEMALPPCHIMCQFNVHDGNKLSCSMYQRSCDVPLGSPFNIASYSFLTHLLAKHCGLEAHEFIYFMGNCHIYEDHIEAMRVQVERQPFEFPKIEIKATRENIDDYLVDDFVISGYQSGEPIKMKMVA
jgi:thymidylate synthase